MLNLKAKACVVVGGGTVAARKVAGLIEAEADITVISPTLNPALQQHANSSAINWVQSNYQSGMLARYAPMLVFAATDDTAINHQVMTEARQIQALVNSVDAPANSDFSNMATIRREPIIIGLHTGSTSPALARHLKARIAATIGPEYETLATWLGELRPKLRQHIPIQSRRQQFYQTVLDSDILLTLRQGEIDSARHRLDALIQEWL
jgi:precorrin-2 dehydrogenase/sirohydrochlorin ferrochelatase